jgi:hypothetical protein
MLFVWRRKWELVEEERRKRRDDDCVVGREAEAPDARLTGVGEPETGEFNASTRYLR